MVISTSFSKRFMRVYAIVGLLYINILSSGYAKASIQLRDVTKDTSITFKHTDGSSGNFYLIEAVAAGLALFDYDNDGDIDIYFLNGSALKGKEFAQPPKNAMYRNDGNFKFTDVTQQSGLGDTGYGLGVAVGDYDNDGDRDVYLNNYGPNVLYRNNGNGTFTDVTNKTGVDNRSKVGAGTCFLDIDKDGYLDLYVSNYITFSYETNVIVIMGGHKAYVDPTVYLIPPDSLYRNNRDGTFTDVSEISGIAKSRGTGMGMVCADYDNDGDTDVFVLNDQMANFLFENDGTGKFKEVGLLAGVAYNINGTEYGSMGVDCGDFDNDGLLDFYATSYEGQWATLYKNLDDGLFEDATFYTGAGAGTFNNVTWGNGLVDFDNDGDKDIFVAVGHMQVNVEKYSDQSTYFARNLLLMNTGKGKFVNISDKCGDGLKPRFSSRGAGFDDLDNDGDIDIVILNSRREPTILRNDTKNKNHWLQVRLRGTKTNHDGIGAHVKVVAGNLVQIDEVHSGRGYQGHHGMRLHFGLGQEKKVDRIEVRWIGGGVDVFKDIPADQLITITEGAKSLQK